MMPMRRRLRSLIMKQMTTTIIIMMMEMTIGITMESMRIRTLGAG